MRDRRIWNKAGRAWLVRSNLVIVIMYGLCLGQCHWSCDMLPLWGVNTLPRGPLTVYMPYAEWKLLCHPVWNRNLLHRTYKLHHGTETSWWEQNVFPRIDKLLCRKQALPCGTDIFIHWKKIWCCVEYLSLILYYCIHVIIIFRY